MARTKKPLLYGYEAELALSGSDAALPPIETWPNQYRGYEIKIECPEFTSVCPKTKLPDFGTLCLRYLPDKECVELKSFKYYLLGYRNMGIFYENAVNRVLDDVVKAVKPVWAELEGRFTSRGGMHSTVTARYPRKSR
jgi:7-cyano-7-deazaguanine reductase